jgi:glycerol-3-phosphate dehydrogenase (NAD(P)+)
VKDRIKKLAGKIIRRKIDKITIIGAGAFGFAFAKLISENQLEKDIFLYDTNNDFIEHIKKTREHPLFHKDTKLPEHVQPITDLDKALDGVDLIVLAVPSRFLREALVNIKSKLKKRPIFLSLVKGLELDTGKTPYAIVHEVMGNRARVCVLSGGMIAREVTLENPLSADLACRNKKLAKRIASMLWTDYFRVRTTTDILGVAYAGAFKNVIAIGAGIFDGCGYGESSKSAFVSTAAKEMGALAWKLGARKKTYASGSQAWFGDLMTTCFGASRNRELGELIGKGMEPKEAVEMMLKQKKSVEGYYTTQVVFELASKQNLKTPLINLMNDVLFEGKKPKDFVTHFIKV